MVNQDKSVSALELRGVSVGFRSRRGRVQAVDDVSFRLRGGEILGVVGESGCGKSTLGLGIARLLPEAAEIQGQILLAGESISDLSQRELQHVRGAGIGMVFQDAMTALNPAMAVGRQITEAIRAHGAATRRAASRQAVELLRMVGIPDAEKRYHDFVHQLSGGLRQRVGIAIGIACHPQVLIADEPTTALDATVEAQVLDVIRQLRAETGVAVLLITHDIGVIAELADRVMVMYAGRAVEEGPTERVIRYPRHPYTKRLIAAVPRRNSGPRLQEIPGIVPTLAQPAQACAFAPRCHRATAVCSEKRPEMEDAGNDTRVACFWPEGD